MAAFVRTSLLAVLGWACAAAPVERFIAVNGVRLHYLDWGPLDSGARPVLVFLPGLGNTANIYAGLAPKFVGTFHVVALTRRGHGKSDRPASGYDIATLSADVAEFLRILGQGKPVILAGHSFAGVEMVRVARTHPELVNRLVFLDATYDFAHGAPIVRRIPLLPSRPPDPAGVAPATRRALLDTMYAFADDYRGIRAPGLAIVAVHERLPESQLPADPGRRREVEKFWKDVYLPFFRASNEQFRSQMPSGSRLVELPNTGHFLFHEREAEVVREMLAFLKRSERIR